MIARSKLALVIMAAFAACATTSPPAPPTSPAPPSPAAPVAATPQRDGQHDFDFHRGTWKTKISRRLHPLTGSTTWVEYVGTTVVRDVWNGRANLVELVADGPAGHLELLSLRLYDPESRQWHLHVASSSSGAMSPPTTGHFANGRGELFSRESIGGRDVLVRFVISEITATSCRFEQAFSADGGTTWEMNWIATDTRAD